MGATVITVPLFLCWPRGASQKQELLLHLKGWWQKTWAEWFRNHFGTSSHGKGDVHIKYPVLLWPSNTENIERKDGKTEIPPELIPTTCNSWKWFRYETCLPTMWVLVNDRGWNLPCTGSQHRLNTQWHLAQAGAISHLPWWIPHLGHQAIGKSAQKRGYTHPRICKVIPSVPTVPGKFQFQEEFRLPMCNSLAIPH